MTKSSACVTELHFGLPPVTSDLIVQNNSKLVLYPLVFFPLSASYKLLWHLILLTTAHGLKSWKEAGVKLELCVPGPGSPLETIIRDLRPLSSLFPLVCSLYWLLPCGGRLGHSLFSGWVEQSRRKENSLILAPLRKIVEIALHIDRKSSCTLHFKVLF